jgi:hypothetical protein
VNGCPGCGFAAMSRLPSDESLPRDAEELWAFLHEGVVQLVPRPLRDPPPGPPARNISHRLDGVPPKLRFQTAGNFSALQARQMNHSFRSAFALSCS